MSSNKNASKHLLELAKNLKEGEEVIVSIYGGYETTRMGTKTVRNGVFALTEDRLIFCAKKMFGYDLESFQYKKVSSIERSKSMMGHSITVHASNNEALIKWINDTDFEFFMETFENKMNEN